VVEDYSWENFRNNKRKERKGKKRKSIYTIHIISKPLDMDHIIPAN